MHQPQKRFLPPKRLLLLWWLQLVLLGGVFPSEPRFSWALVLWGAVSLPLIVLVGERMLRQ